jgi:hypothetical protein
MGGAILGLLGSLLQGAVKLLPYLLVFIAGGRDAERRATNATLAIVEKHREILSRPLPGPDAVLAGMRERERAADR